MSFGGDDLGRIEGQVRIDTSGAESDLARARQAMDAAADAAEKVGAAADRAGSKVAGSGQAALQSGRALQDLFQGGFAGILNNIEGLVLSLGGTAGLAGVLTAAGIAATLAIPRLAALFEAIAKGTDGAIPEVDRLKARIKELESIDASVRLAVDDHELDESRKKLERLIEAQKVLNALMGRQTEEEQASGRAVEAEFTGEAGRAALAGAQQRRIREAEAASGPLREAEARRAEAERQLAAAEARLANLPPGSKARGFAEETVNAARREVDAQREAASKARGAIRENVERELGERVRQATRGVGAEQAAAQRALGAEVEGVGAGDLAGRLGRATPEGLAARRRFEQFLESRGEQDDARRKAEDKADRERERQAERLEEQESDAHFKRFDDARKAEDKAEKDAQKAAEPDRQIQQMNRHLQGAIRQEAYQQVGARGGTPQQAEALVRETNAAMREGLNAQRAMVVAWNRLFGEVAQVRAQQQAIMREVRAMEQQQRFAQQFGNTGRGTVVPPGRRAK